MATYDRTSSGRWRAQVRRKGSGARSRTFDTRDQARAWAEQVEGRHAAGELIDLAEARRTTLREALQRYLEEVTPTKRGHVQERNRIRAWLRDPLTSRSLASIRSVDIAEWRSSRSSEGKAPTTVKNALQIVSQVYVLASTEWGMDGLKNPVRGVRMPASRAGRERRLELEEEDRLLAGCDASGCPWVRPIVSLAIDSAMRQGELLGLRRENIRGQVAYLPQTKNGRSRSVPLSSRALATLRELPAEAIHGPLFPIGVDSLEYYWRKACRLAGIEDLKFHDLRHEATSRLFERGLDVMEVAAITGHRTLAMLSRYTHLKAVTLAAKLG
jgi:integrase